MFRVKNETRVLVMTPEDAKLYGVNVKGNQNQAMTILFPTDCLDMLTETQQAGEIVFIGNEHDQILRQEARNAGFEFRAAGLLSNVISKWQ